MCVLAGCGSAERDARETPADTVTDARDEPQAPWRTDSLAASEVPPVYLAEWREAENRATCAPIAPNSLGRGADAEVRSALFGGGWGVAYDTQEIRSAFGVTGTGVSDTSDTYDEWPHTRRWADGSYVGYGPEGGSGPNQLAYLWIEGQECLYNIWSRLGVDHLEFLLEQLRFVATGDGRE